MSDLQHQRIAELCQELRLSAVPNLYSGIAQSAAAKQVHWLALRRAAIHESISGAPIMARKALPGELAASAEPLE